MSKFYVDAAGNYLGQFDAMPPGAVEVPHAPKDARQKWSGGAWQPLSAAESYANNRARAYPPIGEQLDALWHAMNAGTLPKVEPFYSQLKAVKDQYPKAGAA